MTTIRGRPDQRRFWRDLHALTGVFASAVILFLAVTGMPWSMFWGDHVQRWVTARNLYEPAAPVKVTPSWMLTMDMPPPKAMAQTPHDHMGGVKPDLPWALEKAPMPMSMPMPGAARLSVDAAIARFRALGLKEPFSVALPAGPEGAYVGDYRPDHVEESRTVYLDQYSGRVLGDVGYRQWGPAAKAIEWGVAVHQGQEYGPFNRWLMLAGCLAVVLLGVSAPVMWWKRRPKGRLGAPPLPANRGAAWAALGVMAVVGLVYPLVGASLLVALIVDRLWSRIAATG